MVTASSAVVGTASSTGSGTTESSRSGSASTTGLSSSWAGSLTDELEDLGPGLFGPADGRLAKGGHLLAEGSGELELADHAERDECLAQSLARLALPVECAFELRLGDEPACDEDLADPAPVGAQGSLERRPCRSPGILPLLGDHLCQLRARDAEALDQDLAELLVGLLLDLERHPDLALGDEPALDEEAADQPGGNELLRSHSVSIGNPPFGLQGHLASVARPSPACTTPCSYAYTTACTRSRSRSFMRILATCVFTVVSLTWASAAISALESPRAM